MQVQTISHWIHFLETLCTYLQDSPMDQTTEYTFSFLLDLIPIHYALTPHSHTFWSLIPLISTYLAHIPYSHTLRSYTLFQNILLLYLIPIHFALTPGFPLCDQNYELHYSSSWLNLRNCHYDVCACLWKGVCALGITDCITIRIWITPALTSLHCHKESSNKKIPSVQIPFVQINLNQGTDDPSSVNIDWLINRWSLCECFSKRALTNGADRYSTQRGPVREQGAHLQFQLRSQSFCLFRPD